MQIFIYSEIVLLIEPDQKVAHLTSTDPAFLKNGEWIFFSIFGSLCTYKVSYSSLYLLPFLLLWLVNTAG